MQPVNNTEMVTFSVQVQYFVNKIASENKPFTKESFQFLNGVEREGLLKILDEINRLAMDQVFWSSVERGTSDPAISTLKIYHPFDCGVTIGDHEGLYEKITSTPSEEAPKARKRDRFLGFWGSGGVTSEQLLTSVNKAKAELEKGFNEARTGKAAVDYYREEFQAKWHAQSS